MKDGRISLNLLATSGKSLVVFLLDRYVRFAVCCAYSRIHLSRLYRHKNATRSLQHCYAKAGRG